MSLSDLVAADPEKENPETKEVSHSVPPLSAAPLSDVFPSEKPGNVC